LSIVEESKSGQARGVYHIIVEASDDLRRKNVSGYQCKAVTIGKRP